MPTPHRIAHPFSWAIKITLCPVRYPTAQRWGPLREYLQQFVWHQLSAHSPQDLPRWGETLTVPVSARATCALAHPDSTTTWKQSRPHAPSQPTAEQTEKSTCPLPNPAYPLCITTCCRGLKRRFPNNVSLSNKTPWPAATRLQVTHLPQLCNRTTVAADCPDRAKLCASPPTDST
jgi:hypothetical protein